MLNALVAVVSYIITIITLTNGLQCVDHNNNPVDWFVVYKLPEIKHHHKLLRHGVAYTYATSNDFGEWKFGNLSINSTDSIIALTLKALYENSEDNLYILYNDEPPSMKPRNNKGHTKGVVLADKHGGIWLVHSVPHFPRIGPNYTYPLTGSIYGQSFLCISLDLKNLDIVGTQLQYNQPEIYSQHIPDALKSITPELVKAAANVTTKTPPWFHTAALITENKTNFLSFAKSKDFAKDLYADWIAVSLNTNLLVETWPNGAGRLPSKCANHTSVFNIESVTINVANVSFTSTDDHSKWAVSQPSKNSAWICIGDINRMESQKKRGGGSVCTNNQMLASLYQACVTTIQKC